VLTDSLFCETNKDSSILFYSILTESKKLNRLLFAAAVNMLRIKAGAKCV